MNSSPIAETRTGTTDDQPLLSNPYRYWVMLNRPRFGKRAQGERHSLAQLYGLYRDRPDTLAEVSLSFYSYRSLLLFKLVRELPMPVPFGVLAARLLVDSLVIVGVHERGTEGRMELEAASDAGPASIRIRAPRRSEAVMNERGLLRKLSALGLSSLSVVAPPWGASIHYAGSVPFAGTRPARWTCSRRFEVEGFPGVFLADSSAWGELPAKGLTLTIMAHARALADQVAGR